MHVKKKNLCPEWDLNCCTPAWRSELLPTGLLGSVNIRCCVHYSGFSIVMYGETKLAVSQERKRKSKIPKYFLLSV